MNSIKTSSGGWPASELRTYINTTLYNEFPTDLKSAVIDTTVVSGYEHGKTVLPQVHGDFVRLIFIVTLISMLLIVIAVVDMIMLIIAMVYLLHLELDRMLV